MNKDCKDKKQNISVSLHEDIISLVVKYCKENKLKKSKLIENILKEYFNKKTNENE